jgi:glycerol kinase
MFILGIDQGTSGSKAMLLDREGNVRSIGYQPLKRIHPKPDWTEQDPRAIAQSVSDAITQAIAKANCKPSDIVACGIASQRNTDVVWDARTNEPITNAIVWQDLRSQDVVKALSEAKSIWNEAHHRLGQQPGPYSAAAHLGWRMRHSPLVIEASQRSALRIGLPGEWVLLKLGRLREHAMDYSLVQALSLYDFRAEDYWQDYLDWLRVPREALPIPRPSVHDYGTIRVVALDGEHADVPVLAMIGDQQAAMFGYGCRKKGEAECTHGTATFVNVCAGSVAPISKKLHPYYAWVLADETGSLHRSFCLEADATVTGAALRWMRENARFLDDEKEVSSLAESVSDSGGVTFVPAFTGLNVPYDDHNARATILGLSLGTTRAHIARAFLDSLGFQVRAILDAVNEETGIQVDHLKVGGGVSASDIACQLQADWLGIPISRPKFADTTPFAAALLAGLGANVWSAIDALPALPEGATLFEPRLSQDQRDTGYARWNKAVELVREHG